MGGKKYLMAALVMLFSTPGAFASVLNDKVEYQKGSNWYTNYNDGCIDEDCKSGQIADCIVSSIESSAFYDVDGIRGYWDVTSSLDNEICEYWDLNVGPTWKTPDSCSYVSRTVVLNQETGAINNWDYSHHDGLVRFEWYISPTWHAEEVWLVDP